MEPTDLTIPFADAVEGAVEEPIVKLEVPAEGDQTKTEEVRANETPCVDVWVTEGQKELREAKEEMPMI